MAVWLRQARQRLCTTTCRPRMEVDGVVVLPNRSSWAITGSPRYSYSAHRPNFQRCQILREKPARWYVGLSGGRDAWQAYLLGYRGGPARPPLSHTGVPSRVASLTFFGLEFRAAVSRSRWRSHAISMAFRRCHSALCRARYRADLSASVNAIAISINRWATEYPCDVISGSDKPNMASPRLGISEVKCHYPSFLPVAELPPWRRWRGC
jgi:hypothetical protein